MGKEFFKKTTDLLQAKQKKKQWQKIVISLSLVVAMITSGLLIHPAITMERKAICGQVEHTHSADCYEKKLICDKEEHTASEVEAAAAEGKTIEDHKHTDSCYKEELTCDKKEHKHSEDCYPKETEAKEKTTKAASTEEAKATAADNTEAKTTEAPKAEEPTEASKEEKKTEETTEAEKQEEKAEARTLTEKGDGYTIQVDCPAEAKIPENAELKVREIKKEKEADKEEYEAYYKKAQGALKEKEGEETDISTVRFFDITFMVDGKEIEPEAKVEVKITYDKKVEVSDKGEVKSVHFGDEKTEVLDVKTNKENGKMDEVTFDATSFSVYAIVGTETLTGGVITADGKSYTVEVTYGEDAQIPDDAELKVAEIYENSTEYQNYSEKALVAMTDDEEAEVTSARFFDVSIMVNGQKYEPKAAVKVKITYNDPFSVDIGDEIKQVHFADSGIEVLDVEVDKDDKGQITDVTFNQDSFSVTGTVIVTGSDGWPAKAGKYAVIVKASDNKYYAVKKDGALTEVEYDGTTQKVSFIDITKTDDLIDYEWEFTKESEWYSTSYYLSNDSYYIDPTDSAGISDQKRPLLRDRNGCIYSKKRKKSYYLTANGGKLIAGNTTSTDYAVKVFFANQFSADGNAGGGSPGGEDSVDLGAPATDKTLTDNGNGTYNLSLSVKGKSQAQSSRSKADIVIVFDRSTSMDNSTTDGRRDAIAIKAVNSLVDTLMNNNTAEYPDTVQMAVVEFGNNAEVNLQLSNNKSTVKNTINGLTAYSAAGTNWEAGLKKASSIPTRSDATKYVIFVSDGNPTFYSTDSGDDNWNKTYKAYGSGEEQETNIRRSYNAAKDDARALVNSGASFYTIGVFGNPDRMSNLTAFAYSGNDIGTYPSGHYQTASDQTSLNKAFQSIINDIQKNFSYTDVTINDGITDLTSTAAINGVAGGFTYSVTDANGNAVSVPDTIKTASYDAANKKVVWSLGAGYQLEDGYTYKVSFTVWPTQQAYDILAALKNGDITFGDSSAVVNGNTVDWSQFIQNADGTYSLKTNTNANATYRQLTTTNGVAGEPSDLKTSAITAKPSMPLANTAMTVQKIWDDSSNTSSRPSEITLDITKDGVTYQSVTLNDSNEWKATIYIAPGLKVDDTILESGHEYTVVEPGNTRYEFEAEKVHPMLINSSSQITYGGDGDAIIKAINTLKLSVFNVELIKVDSSNQNKTLSGAEFKLYKEDGETIATNADGEAIGVLKTDNAGKVTIGKLIEGTYILRETKAPDGYNLGDDITIVVTENKVIFTQQGNQKDGTASGDGFTYTLTITNSAGQELPMTGGSGTLPYTLGGLLLICAAALMYGFIMRRRGRRLN